MKKIIFIMSFFLIICMPQLAEAEGVEKILRETENIYADGFSVNKTAEDFLDGKIDLTFSGVLGKLSDVFFGKMKESWSTVIKMTAVGIFSGICAVFCGEKNDVGALSCGAVAGILSLNTFVFVTDTAKEAIDTLFIFVQALLPSVAACSLAIGQTAQSTVCATVFIAMQAFIYICKNFFIPFICIITALGVTERLGDTLYLKGLTKTLKSVYKWGTGLALTLYGIVLGIQSQAAGTFDTAMGKTVKYTIGSVVPVVGGALSDSLELVGMSAKTIKSALGLSGIVGVGFLSLTPLINVCTIALAYKIASCFCSMVSDSIAAKIIGEVGENLTRICGVILSVSIMFVISLAMLCRFGGGGF